MGWGRNATIMHTSLQGQQEVYFYFEGGILNKPWLISTWLNIVFHLTKKVKINNTWLFWNLFNVLNCSSLLFWLVMCKKYYKLVRVQVLRSQLSYVGGILLCGCLEKLTPFLIKDILILVRNMMKHSHGWYFSSG